jgi:hypothetical protein
LDAEIGKKLHSREDLSSHGPTLEEDDTPPSRPQANRLNEMVADGHRRRRVRRDNATGGIEALAGVPGWPNLVVSQVPADVFPHNDASVHLVAHVHDHSQNFTCFQDHDFIILLIHT